MKTIESIILLPSQEKFIYPALAFIKALADSCGFSEQSRNDIEIAAEEALTNVIQHAFEGSADETFKLSVGITNSDFILTIYEKGMPFNPDGVTGYDPEKVESTQQADGLGLYLMKRMMDDVIFENLGREGKSLTLIKHIDEVQKKSISESFENRNLIRERKPVSSKGINYEIRPFGSEDALEISRCAYRAYGYTYEPYIYYSEKIIEMNRAGYLRSYIASSRNSGELMGHIALKYRNPDDPVAEAGAAFVKPEYRGSGILKSMMTFCHEKAEEYGLTGLFGRAVTSHVYSQKAADSFGYRATGVFFGLFPDDVDFKAISGKIRQKESGLLLYKSFSGGSRRKIYAPVQYKDILQELLDSVNIPVQFNENETECSAGHSEIAVKTDSVLNIADVEVFRAGADFAFELKKLRNDLCLRHVDAIYLHINMEETGSAFAAAQGMRLGFFFCGVLPFGLKNRHELIMQYMNNLKIDYEIIKPYSPRAVEILNYVRSSAVNSVD